MFGHYALTVGGQPVTMCENGDSGVFSTAATGPEQSKGKPYSIRSAGCVFDKAAAAKAGMSIHSLRHAFAAHLLEQGTGIKFIQELSGHQSVRTTEIYTHVSKKEIGQIRSPIDSIVQTKGKKTT